MTKIKNNLEEILPDLVEFKAKIEAEIKQELIEALLKSKEDNLLYPLDCDMDESRIDLSSSIEAYETTSSEEKVKISKYAQLWDIYNKQN
jgi:hypothetical protein